MLQPQATLIDLGTNHKTALFECRDGVAVVRVGKLPDQGKPEPEHFDEYGRWIGPDQEAPFRVITRGAGKFRAAQVEQCFARYDCQDYGTGEAGFAIYCFGEDRALWLVDDAVRSPEGEPPARDPRRSPGPQTLLTPSEY